ncbi:N-6 DNA methylase [Ruegeria sp. HKCCD7318]|uniref:N-6 DNA methylase n=1 Tax=Ruegeria sp. HKCCD7318 TaxID=2683014 RepID=UPI0020A191C2|nr:N-6 DNA methylase [Ruegeria sp. HKCCD7318]
MPNSVFKPYASIGTNLLFFEKGKPTEEVWYWEHKVPSDRKAYSMTKPIELGHLEDCVEWWSGEAREGREAGPQAWKVSIDEIKERGFNLDVKNPHSEEDDLGDPETLAVELQQAEADVVALRDQLKSILSEALLR